MNINVDENSTVPCGQKGTLTLLGIEGTIALFVATNLEIVGNAKKHADVIFGTTSTVELMHPDDYGHGSLVFQYDIGGPVRNQKGLLVSVRNKLQTALYHASSEYSDETEKFEIMVHGKSDLTHGYNPFK